MLSSSPEVRRPLRRVEYDQLVSKGVFADERLELLDGFIVQMSPIGPPHCATLDRLTRLLMRGLGDEALIRIQSPFAASDLSEPEPDLSLVPLGDYDTEHPSRAYLIIEVADASLATDRGHQAQLYAECEVPEYWVVNLDERQVEVHTRPVAGRYTQITVDARGARIALQEFPEFEFAVDQGVR